MDATAQARDLVLQQCARYPGLAAQDVVKALYQAAFGCGHFVEDEARAAAYLNEEAASVCAKADDPCAEPVGGRYCRVHLSGYLGSGAALSTLAKLFVLSARDDVSDRGGLFEAGLNALSSMADAGELPLCADEVRDYLSDYCAQGCPSVRHTQAFRDRYAPAYRVVRAAFADLLPLFARIDEIRREKGRVLVAIDGPSASGKSTLGEWLQAVYGATLLHMDDFFLQPHQRTAKRLATPGGNVDRERFFDEVLTPLARGDGEFAFRPYECWRQALGDPVRVAPGEIVVVEGSYSLHPDLAAHYDLRVGLKIDPKTQSARILARNGEEMHARFMNEWVPMERLYAEATALDLRCDLRFDVREGAQGVRFALLNPKLETMGGHA